MIEIDRDTYDKIIEMHSNIKHIAEEIDKMSCQLDDHEKRIRMLEKCSIEDHEDRIRALEVQQNRWLGRNAAIGFAILVLLQVIGFLTSLPGK
jgi:rRNA processing protein Krr1/Pno1